MDLNRKSKVSFAPLRSLDDFLLSSARFQLSNNWGNRTKQNLIYYQTNYFLIFILFFLVYCHFHPLDIFIGIITVAICILVEISVTQPQWIWVASKVFIAFVFFKSLKYILILAMGLFIPLIFVTIHAMFRMRNFHNKITNASNVLANTPMGIVLNGITKEKQ